LTIPLKCKTQSISCDVILAEKTGKARKKEANGVIKGVSAQKNGGKSGFLPLLAQG
jgi:hypothetical protein